MSLPAAVKSGDRAKALQAIRDRLADELESADAQYVAGLAKQLQAVLAELDGLPSTVAESKVDDLANARKARRANATGGVPPDRGGDVGGAGSGRAR